MAVEPGQEARAEQSNGTTALVAGIGALARATAALASVTDADHALRELVDGLAAAVSADAVVVRVCDGRGAPAAARAVAARSAALAAELEGSRVERGALPDDEADEGGRLPEHLRRAAERARAEAVLALPVSVRGRPVGSLELLRRREAFSPAERALARLGAAHAGFVLGGGYRASGALGTEALRLAGDALAAGSDETRTAEQIARVAAEVTDAEASLVWRLGEDDAPQLIATHGLAEDAEELETAADAAHWALAERDTVSISTVDGGGTLATLHLGEPPLGLVQLLFEAGRDIGEPDLGALSVFATRAAHALRAGERSRLRAAELERTRALLSILGQAIAQLSLAHTLETATEQVALLLGSDRLAVYLLDDERQLSTAAGRGLAGPHVRVAERLLELALGPDRGRPVLSFPDAQRSAALTGVRDALAEAGIEAALAAPLLAHEETIGLLGVYGPRGYEPTEEETALLAALSTQLAVAVQNARLHEETKRLKERAEEEQEKAERERARTDALSQIARSFAESLSLEATLEAVARSAVELLGVDAAVLRMPAERRDLLVPGALHVADERVGEAVRAILARPQELPAAPAFRLGRPLILDAAVARKHGSPHELLTPFLEKGSTAAVLPVATQPEAEALGTLTILSLDPARPITPEMLETALSLAGQAALALDNARLYQQQKHFADTMRRSLLPRARPELDGLELGDKYASPARVDVGGDVYDFAVLGDGRLAVVLGDVTGHGIDAAADMAMAKFVFRSLAREHPEPADFLSAANDVVVEEIGAGKFITMLYLTLDPRGAFACACAGHPPPRVLLPESVVEPVETNGVALGIEPDQTYDEVRGELPAGAAVVLFTDGVVEARRDGELYGEERLDRLLAGSPTLSAQELAEAVLEDCRAFSGGELRDDCAVVVLKRV
ncbi:MAG: SpoIIE family protein phosphatase [Gaiellaceae bacterium]